MRRNEAEEQKRLRQITRLNNLYSNLVIIIEQYLMHELQGQQKKFFSPSHANKVKALKNELDEIISLDKMYSPDMKINKIYKAIELYKSPQDAESRSPSELKKYNKGGENFARALKTVLSKDLTKSENKENEKRNERQLSKK